MADSDQPFRLLDLPPELRVRIYECFFELPTSLEAIDIFEAQQHAPNLAIAATSRLIRREALDLGRQAVVQFYQQHSFFLQLPAWVEWQWNRELQAAEAAVKTLPMLPISTFENRYTVGEVKGERLYVKVVMSISATGEIEATCRCRRDADEDYSPPARTNSSSVQRYAQVLDVAMTWGTSLQYLDIRNVMRAQLLSLREECDA
ncbi:hypothetical protein LTS10_010691 [Elasticomyces elasticus]|nr:hypothetical protein LTS10_010691 [Elasticomyces elasticus]